MRKHSKPISDGILARTLRRIGALLCIAFIVLFLMTTGTSIALRLHWFASVQIVPAILSASGFTLALWLAVTILFGRIYCSMICPMGVVQDIFARLPRIGRKMQFKRGYSYTHPRNPLRYGWLVLVVLTALAGAAILLTLFDPYAAFSRIIQYLVRPIYLAAAGKTLVAGTALGVAIAVVTLLIVAAVAAKSGRTICNTFCPVGSLLSIPARYSLYGIDINTDLCVGCTLCSRVCKSRCIDPGAHTVDNSRCVVCLNCLTVCENGAITYTRRRHRLQIPMMIRSSRPTTSASIQAPGNTTDSAVHTPDQPRKIDRRKFLATGLIMAVTPAVLAADRKLSAILPNEVPQAFKGLRPVTPPGVVSTADFLARCVGCGACISACPTRVLKPSSTQYGLIRPMAPLKDYDLSYCEFDCTACTHVCPTGALRPLDEARKHDFVVGHAIVAPDYCIGCGLCAHNCPKDTIIMVNREDLGLPTQGRRRRVAHINPVDCIGCGLCRHVCPADPRAIAITGLPRK